MFNFMTKLKNSRHSLWYLTASLICRVSLPFFQKFGINITVNHYYSPVPDIKETEKLYKQFYGAIHGQNFLKFDLDEHLRFIENINNFVNEFNDSELAGIIVNSSFGSIDAEILYSMVRKNKPKKIIEIGGGISSKIISNAVRKNNLEKNSCKYICVEPFPTKILIETIHELGDLIKKKVEDVEINLFESLGENDILFIDSSHVVKPFNDVYFVFFKVLPFLKKGVLVHFHDIYLPAEYPITNITKYNYFWNEQYMLHSFLLFNDYFIIEWSGSFAHLNIVKKLEDHFISYNPKNVWPGSFWTRKIQ
jgi:predicted O-methyltransferase YrrM